MNCSGWNEALLERELAERLGRASGGTLFLDDLHEVTPPVFDKVLRFIDTKRFDDTPMDVRIIAACEAAPEINVHFIQFGIRLTLPPLRDRKLDIPILVDHFIEQYAAEFGKIVRGIHPIALRRLVAYQWPGNMRELKNAVERAVILATVGHAWTLRDFSFLAMDEDVRPFQFVHSRSDDSGDRKGSDPADA